MRFAVPIFREGFGTMSILERTNEKGLGGTEELLGNIKGTRSLGETTGLQFAIGVAYIV